MTITLNGQPKTLPEGTTVLALLAQLNLSPDKVAIELNKRLLRTPHYDRPLSPNDTLEIVTFVGGGC